MPPDKIDFGGLGLLCVALGYAHATKTYTGRPHLSNLIETLKKSKRRYETLYNNNKRGAERNGRIDELLFENDQLKLQIVVLKRKP